MNINKLIHFSINNRLFVIASAFILIIWGILSFQKLPIDALPDITNVQVQINTKVIGLVPEEIERIVTFPIESLMTGLPEVEGVRSISRYGLSQVTVVFSDHMDILKARQLVSEKLSTVDLPNDLKPEMGPMSTGLGEIYHYAIESVNPKIDKDERLLELMELRSIQEYFVKPRLLQVPGVVEVNTIGGYEKQIFVEPNIKKMARYGIHFDDIKNAIEASNKNVGGGYVEQTGEQFLVRGVGLFSEMNDIKDVVVKRLSSYEVIKIKDIAKVELGREIRTGLGTLNGEETVLGTAFMLLGANSRDVSKRVHEKLLEIKKDLPSNITLETVYDRSHMVDKTLSTVEHNLIMGATLVILFLMLLVGDFRASIITSLMIPISLLITFILMKWQNISGNLMSLGALDFGIIIDGAVIVVENCVHRIQDEAKRLGRDLTKTEVKDVVERATVEIRTAAGFGELIVIVVFIPLFALSGIEGKMFSPMAMTFIFALLSALLLSFTLVPALCSLFLSGKKKDKKTFLMDKFSKFFNPILDYSLTHKKKIISFGIFSILLGTALFSKLGSEFIPKLDEGDFAIQFIRPNNISSENSSELMRISEKIIKSFPEVKNVFSRTGAAEVATDPMGINISDTYVMLNDGVKDKKKLIEKIRHELEESVPAQVLMFSQPVELRFNELLEGARAEISAKVYGEDMDKLLSLSHEIEEVIEKVDGAREVESESKGKSPVLEFKPRTKILSEMGVTVAPVLDAVQVAIGGYHLGHIFEGVRKYPIVLRLSEEERSNYETIKNLPVGISEGYTVPMSKVSDINFVETYTNIARENSQRRIAVLINPESRDVESFVLKAKKEVEEKVNLPKGYYVDWGGSFKNLIEAKKNLGFLVPISLLIIFFMLYGAFKNFTQVFLIFLCAPMSLIGGVLFLNLFSIPFSISSGVGFIALSGISILNGVVLMSTFNKLTKDGHTLHDVVTMGSMTRLRPVVMTALTDIFGFLPMMFSTSLGAEVQKPLATVVVGGVLSSTLLTLVVLPSFYYFICEIKEKRKLH